MINFLSIMELTQEYERNVPDELARDLGIDCFSLSIRESTEGYISFIFQNIESFGSN